MVQASGKPSQLLRTAPRQPSATHTRAAPTLNLLASSGIAAGGLYSLARTPWNVRDVVCRVANAREIRSESYPLAGS